MVCDNHGRNYQLGDPLCWLLLTDRSYLQGSYWEKEVRRQQAQRRLVGTGTLTVGDEWEGIIYSLGQIIAPFGPELENSF